MALSIRLLRIFRAVARQGGIAPAARVLNLSPAAVSEAVSDLEAMLGQPLFERAMKRLRLNAAGAALLPRAENVLTDVDDIERDLRNQRVRLEIGASVTVGNYLLSPLLLRLAQAHPEFDVAVAIRNTQAIAEAVETFQVAVAFVEGVVARDALRVRRWRYDDLILIAPAKHRLAGKEATPDDLAAETWVLRETGSGTRATFESAAGGHFTPRRIAFTVGGNQLLKDAVLGGVGMGCISREAVRDELAGGRLVEIRAPWLSMRRDLSVIVHGRKAIDPPLRTLLRLCRETADAPYADNFADVA